MPANTSFTQFERISDQIGGAAALRETLHVNRLDLEPLKNAARVWALSSKNISRQTTAGLLGITPARVGQIIAQLNEEGFGGLEDSVLFATNPVDEVNSHV